MIHNVIIGCLFETGFQTYLHQGRRAIMGRKLEFSSPLDGQPQKKKNRFQIQRKIDAMIRPEPSQDPDSSEDKRSGFSQKYVCPGVRSESRTILENEGFSATLLDRSPTGVSMSSQITLRNYTWTFLGALVDRYPSSMDTSVESLAASNSLYKHWARLYRQTSVHCAGRSNPIDSVY